MDGGAERVVSCGFVRKGGIGMHIRYVLETVAATSAQVTLQVVLGGGGKVK